MLFGGVQQSKSFLISFIIPRLSNFIYMIELCSKFQFKIHKQLPGDHEISEYSQENGCGGVYCCLLGIEVL